MFPIEALLVTVRIDRNCSKDHLLIINFPISDSRWILQDFSASNVNFDISNGITELPTCRHVEESSRRSVPACGRLDS